MAYLFWKCVLEKERYDVLARKRASQRMKRNYTLPATLKRLSKSFFCAAGIASPSLTKVRASHTHGTPQVSLVFPLNSCSCFRCNLYSPAYSSNLSADADDANNRFLSLSIWLIVSMALFD